MKLTDVILPGFLLNEAFFPYLAQPHCAVEALARIADEGFYGAVEIAEVGDSADRARIGGIVRDRGLSLMVWMTLLQNAQRLNLASTDPAERKYAVGVLRGWVPLAAECGARYFALLGGPDPGLELRAHATEALCDSLCTLCDAAQTVGGMTVLMEPLDRGAHKNGLIGPIEEAISLVQRVRGSHPNMGLNWDSSHALLNGESLLASFVAARPYAPCIHIANPVLDRGRPDFGDYHIAMGPPGAMNLERMSQLLRAEATRLPRATQRLGVTVEIRTAAGDDPWATERAGREALVQAWQLTGLEDKSSA